MKEENITIGNVGNYVEIKRIIKEYYELPYVH